MLAMTTLRNILGTRTLAGILSEREEISTETLEILDKATDPWGITVRVFNVKGLRPRSDPIRRPLGGLSFHISRPQSGLL